MRLWFLSLGIVLAFGAVGWNVFFESDGSRFEERVRSRGGTPYIEFVKGVVADLQSKNFSAVDQKSERSIVNEQSRSALAQISNELSSSPPNSIRLAALKWTRGPNDAKGVWHTILSLEYQIEDKWFLVEARVRSNEDESSVLEWLHFQPLPASLESINRSSLRGKSDIHYAFLALCVLVGTYTVAAAIVCLRHKMPVWRKLLWLVGILSGVGHFSLNWTTGSTQFQPLSVHIPNIGGWAASPIAAHTFWCSTPVLALLFLYLHRSPSSQIVTDLPRPPEIVA